MVAQPMTERVFRKTFEVIERPDTKAKRYVKRGCRTVRERSHKFITILKQKHGVTKEIPLDHAKRIFQDEMGIWDRTSLKAYFGTQKSLSKKTIHRTAHYPTGTISHKHIELTQKIQRHEGYLERLGLVCFEKRGSTWFLLIEPESILPEIYRYSKPESECLQAKVNMENFSLTPITLSTPCEPKDRCIVEDREERECIGGERNQSSESILTPIELRILEASRKEGG